MNTARKSTPQAATGPKAAPKPRSAAPAASSAGPTRMAAKPAQKPQSSFNSPASAVTAVASPAALKSPVAEKIRPKPSSATPRRTPFPLQQNQLRGCTPMGKTKLSQATRLKENKTPPSSTDDLFQTENSSTPSDPKAKLPSSSPSAFSFFAAPLPVSRPSHPEVTKTSFGTLVAGIAENVEQLRALYTAELATQDSLIRAAEFEKKRNAKFEVDIIGLMDRIASLETEIRAKSDIISSLSAQRDAAEELKEERERRIAAENESADLRLVVDKLARELEVEKSRRL